MHDQRNDDLTLLYLDAHMNGFDSVVVKAFENKIYTFSRSHTKASYLYWSAVNNNSTSTKWAMVGGSSAKLMTDVAIAYNSFTKVPYLFLLVFLVKIVFSFLDF